MCIDRISECISERKQNLMPDFFDVKLIHSHLPFSIFGPAYREDAGDVDDDDDKVENDDYNILCSGKGRAQHFELQMKSY